MQSFMLLLSLYLFTVLDSALAAPIIEARQSITTLTSAQVNAYKPYTYYAGSAYCKPANTLAWNCGGKFLLPDKVFAWRFTDHTT